MTSAMPLWGTPQCSSFGSWRWLGRWTIIVMVSMCLVLMGCSFASFVAAAQADLPIVLQMVTNITNIIAPQVSAALAVAGGLALVSLKLLCGNPTPGATKCDPSSLIGQYQAATDPVLKASLLQKVQAALLTVNTHITEMLAVANSLPANVGTAIVIAVGVSLETVTLLISLIPKKAALLTGKLGLGKAQWPAHPKDLKHRFNAAVGSAYPAALVN